MFRKLPVADQEQVREALAAAEDDDADIPESHLNILREREARYAAGLSKDIPAEEAFRQIMETLRREQADTP
ncbi:addiction module protein [Prosthecobacter sp.]